MEESALASCALHELTNLNHEPSDAETIAKSILTLRANFDNTHHHGQSRDRGQTKTCYGVFNRAAETGLPITLLLINDRPGYVIISPATGASDREIYIAMTHCATHLGMNLEIVPPRSYWQSQGSDEEHAPPSVLVKSPSENYIIEGDYHSVQLICKSSAREGTARDTVVPTSSQSRELDPIVAAQLQALTAMRGLLSAELPPLSWWLRPEYDKPRLSADIGVYRRRRRARAELLQWADFLGTQIRYDPTSMYSVSYSSAEVTGHAGGVPVIVKAYLRRPLSDTGPWKALRRPFRASKRGTVA
jgi:hypothetical protein